MKSDPTKMRGTNLRDAREMELLPSVTTILSGMIEKPFLIEWAKNNVVDAAVTIPDNIWDANRHNPSGLKTLIRNSEREIVEKAQVFGSTIHDSVEAYMGTKDMTLDPDLLPYMKEFAKWEGANIASVIIAEGTMVADRYAGRLDLIAEMRDGRVGLIDFKTRKRASPRTKAEKESGLGKFGKYETDLLQLAAYRQAYKGPIDFCANVFIDSGATPTPILMREYTEEEMDHDVKTWNALNDCWCLLHKYDPSES